MPPPKKVSVLITTYNFAEFIERAIQSVLQQTYKDIEIIVADDGSSDDSQQIIKSLASKYAPIIIPVLSEVNKGLSHNINQGLDRCKGDFIAILSGDDLMHPDKLSKQIQFLEQNPDCGICTHEMEVFESETGKPLYLTNERYRMPKKSGIEVMLSTNWLFDRPIQNLPSSIVGRADFLSPHRYDVRLRYYNECLYLIDCLAASQKKWGHLPEVLGRYRVHDKQIHANKNASGVFFEETLIMLAIAAVRYPRYSKRIKNKRDYTLFQHLIYDWHSQEKRKAFEKQLMLEAGFSKWLYFKICYGYLHNKRFFEATKFLRKGLLRR